MNPKQQRHVEILTRVEAGALDTATASELLGISLRQLRRQRIRFRKEGMAVAVHGNEGRSPQNRTDPHLVARVLELAGPAGKYHDFNASHLHDLLDLDEHIRIGRSTLDRLLKQHGVRQRDRPSPPSHRRRRTRRAAEGMLLQIDGSLHDWLEGRGPKLSLLGGIDDATGKMVYAHFRPTEDQVGYFLLLRTVAETYGIPMAIYHDRHTILRSPKQPTLEDELAGQPPMSQVQRLMSELGIEAIAAHSPQAKGRIERIWGTFQDRLTKELRLAGINTGEAANIFLPGFLVRYNDRFAVPPADSEPAWVPLPPDLDRSYYFAARETRKVRADNCIAWLGQLFQLLPGPKDPSLVDQTVTVHRVPEGHLFVYYGKQPIAYQVVPRPNVKPAEQRPATVHHDLVQAPARSPDPAANARRRAWLYAKH